MRGLQHLVKNAVDAVTDDQLAFKRLDVNVAGPLLVRLGDQAVDEADNRGLVGSIQEIGRFQTAGQVGPQPFLDILDELLGLSRPTLIGAVDRTQDLVG